MTTPHVKALGISGFLWLVSGCSVTRPLPAAMDAPSLAAYLAEHPAADLRVSQHSGKRYWVHAPEVRGDSLVGRRGYDVSGSRIAVPLGEVVAGGVALGNEVAATAAALDLRQAAALEDEHAIGRLGEDAAGRSPGVARMRFGHGLERRANSPPARTGRSPPFSYAITAVSDSGVIGSGGLWNRSTLPWHWSIVRATR